MEENNEKDRIEKILKSREKQYKRQNDFIKNKYDRVAVLLPHGVKERIKNSGISVNAFINDAINTELEKRGL